MLSKNSSSTLTFNIHFKLNIIIHIKRHTLYSSRAIRVNKVITNQVYIDAYKPTYNLVLFNAMMSVFSVNVFLRNEKVYQYFLNASNIM